MAESSLKTPGMFDPEALLAVQRRNVESFTKAGRIVADGMRTCAEGQLGIMQETMRDLWSELQTVGRAPAAARPSDQPARLRARFDKALAQVQELSQFLLKVQSESMAVLTACATANMEALGGMAPDLVGLNKTATEAMQTASRQVSAVVDELRKRMADLQAESQQAMGATKEGMAPRQTEQETASQSVAGEEDPLAGADQEGPGTSRQRQRG
jgi:rhamnose utilization protein RhaD (predicted bifunctional aldolase and dehydrogenase)